MMIYVGVYKVASKEEGLYRLLGKWMLPCSLNHQSNQTPIPSCASPLFPTNQSHSCRISSPKQDLHAISPSRQRPFQHIHWADSTYIMDNIYPFSVQYSIV